MKNKIKRLFEAAGFKDILNKGVDKFKGLRSYTEGLDKAFCGAELDLGSQDYELIEI